MIDFVFADKPSGVTTHTSYGGESRRRWTDLNDGFCEYLQAHLKEKLFVVHRLDRDTSGAIVFARTPEAAEHLRQTFATRTVEKTYCFLTDRPVDFKSKVHDSPIGTHSTLSGDQETGSSTPSDDSKSAVTEFTLLHESHGLFLWSAKPKTGRTHQIRIHARELGMPILGDTLYGGSEFPQLCLHSESITFNDPQGLSHTHASPRPIWFDDTAIASQWQLARWMSAIDRRTRLWRSRQIAPETLRWIHDEGDPLRVDQLGEVVWMSWYAEEPPSDDDLADIEALVQKMNWPNSILLTRLDRGKTPNEAPIQLSREDLPERWTAHENGLAFEFRRDSGLSSGLFLDQRENRSWIQNHAHGKTVLNLFAYTGGFSVAAAKGGAKKTTTVDVSRNFLEWSKRNFTLNELDVTVHDFRPMDAREYLAWAKKKQISFDLVICDPPSFARGPAGPFRIEKDFTELLQACLDVLAPKGRLLFSLNFEKWSMDDFIARAQKALSEAGRGYTLKSTPDADWDFELPGQPHMMKSFFVEKA